MLRKIRITLATVFFALITLLIVDFTGTLQTYLGWMAKMQLLPAVLALNAVVVLALIVLTLVFGRIYCSVICPLGIMQDILSSINWKKNHFSYSSEKRILRFAMLVILVVAVALGAGALMAFIAPYGSYARIAQNLFQPVYIGVNNLLATVSERMDSYAFYHRDVWIRSMPTFIIAAASFVFIAVLAIRNGRTYCNTICPVGTVLGFLARFSWFKVTIDADKCKNCRKCERNCKASCIDIKNHKIDYSRCVTCGNCMNQCSFGAMSYVHSTATDKKNSSADEQKSVNADGRREFLVGAGLALTGTALAQEKKKVDGGLAVIEDKVQPKRNTPLTPPGSLSAENMRRRCVGCQLCISECPNDVLRPSTDINSLMQPTMSYERGYCRPECNRCSSVCPAGAIKPITLADKSSTQVGHAVWVKKNCIPVCDGIDCGNCARHCPNGAIQMVHINGDEMEPLIPAINEARCTGCGACEYVCPARPFSAIYVEGHEVHKFN